MAKQKGLKFEITYQNLARGLISAVAFFLGFYLFFLILYGKLIFISSNPRRDRTIFLSLAMILMVLPNIILYPNKKGLTGSIAGLMAIYLSMAFITGNLLVFDASSSAMIEYAVALKIITPIACFIAIFAVLFYFAVSDELFRAGTFGGIGIGILAIAMYFGVL